MCCLFPVYREKSLILRGERGINKNKLPASDTDRFCNRPFIFPSGCRTLTKSFRIWLKTLDVRSNSAHEDEWAANCGLSRMSRGSPPAICHSRLVYVTLKISLSLSLQLLAHVRRTALVPSRSRLYIGALAPGRWRNKRKRGRIHHASHFVTAGSTALKLYIRDSRTAHKFSSLRRGFLLNARARERR